MGSRITKQLKRQQTRLLKEIDNYAILLEYNVVIPEKVRFKAEMSQRNPTTQNDLLQIVPIK